MKQFISNLIFFSTLSFALLLSGNKSDLNAETILLKSGEKMEGSIVGQSKETVEFRLEDGSVKTYPKTLIRKISFAKTAAPNERSPIPTNSQKESNTAEVDKKGAQDFPSEKQTKESEKIKSSEENSKKREREISDLKRHYLEGSWGIGGGESQTELRPFYQTIQYAALFFGGSQSQSEILLTPYRTENTSSTARLYYAWNRFSLELRGTEAKGNLEVFGFQNLNFNNGGSQTTSNNWIVGNGNTKFQKVSSRFGFTPYPNPIANFQIIGGVERIWTKTSEEVYSFGEVTPLGNNPNRFSFREYSNPLKGYSYGVAFEFRFLGRFSLQGQILHLEMKGPSSLRNREFRDEFNRNVSQTGLDYQWNAKGREVNLKFSYRIFGNWSLFMEASNLVLKNKLQSGYITDGDGGNSDLSQEIPKLIGPRILTPILYESKTSLSYLQLGVNYRFDF
ncbi:hypothetical protein EHQ12_11655 [Leptospira gomenensis]|uniref:Porin n=1 Tax=Leptospira gomenensis TaxID=2484974 RepID=A0A5F1YBP7_9LEPT|nr:hypothetical protein [Leptospira gomenensis]TGK34950.1 hypothetical protein EHQ17_07930 [Leptospira gomenensis]TGK36746.1 hypothetical protein EHQ12_11655 [Leptospira gomenensis]TGK48849.1 hypothetical protein EHQ07_05780 [Leptospira gomenensis]TGK64615.1 hypothetical protein EHQ13_06955 [Leptospira gomenensis]